MFLIAPNKLKNGGQNNTLSETVGWDPKRLCHLIGTQGFLLRYLCFFKGKASHAFAWKNNNKFFFLDIKIIILLWARSCLPSDVIK